MMMKLAKSSGILVESIDSKKGDINGTLQSTVLMLECINIVLAKQSHIETGAGSLAGTQGTG